MGRNTQNVKFNFGFLNNTQDPTDLKDQEATIATALDPDKLAIGTLATSSLASPVPAPKDFSAAVLNKRRFDIGLSGVLQFEEDSVAENNSFKQVNRNLFPPLGGTVSLNPVDVSAIISPVTGAIPMVINPPRVQSGQEFTGSSFDTYIFQIDNPSIPTYRYFINGILKIQGTSFIVGNYITLPFGNNIEVATDPAYIPSASDSATFTVSKDPLPEDGDYFYKIVNVKNDPAVIKPTENILGLSGDSTSINIKNFDDTGVKISSNSVQVSFPTLPPAYIDEYWCYRKAPTSDIFVRIAKYIIGTDTTFLDRDPNTAISGKTFKDDGITSTILNLKTLTNANDETFADIEQAIGSATTYDMLFEKDGRLWIRPTIRKDLLLYSRLGDWWGWNRANSFSFDGNITNIENLRDPTTVGGRFTTVITTTNGVFHITGDGTESNPYQRVRAIQDINVEENSLVNINGLLTFITKSTDGQYNTGNYGQKVYTYDLQKLTEVSAMVKNIGVVTGTNNIAGTALRGSDKYILNKINSTNMGVYHKDAKGWVETSVIQEAIGWIWKSKDFTSTFLQDFKLVSARFIKMEFVGNIVITFNIKNELDGSIKTIPLAISHPARKEIIQRMPAVKGRKWNFQITGDINTELYNFYFVV